MKILIAIDFNTDDIIEVKNMAEKFCDVMEGTNLVREVIWTTEADDVVIKLLGFGKLDKPRN
jgi:hypothetical protein